MSTVVSALAVVCVLTVSGALLVQLAVSESRRSRSRAALARSPATEPGTLPVQVAQPSRRPVPLGTMPPEVRDLPERLAPPPPPRRAAPPPAPAPPAPVQAVPQWQAPVQPAAWSPALSPDGAWLWTGSAWVPAWWGGPSVPPPPYAIAPQRPARSHGCAAAFGAGCATILGVVALIALGVLALGGLVSRLAGG